MDKKENKKKQTKKKRSKETRNRNITYARVRFDSASRNKKKKKTAISDIFWSISLDGGGGEDEKRKLRLQRISVYTKFFFKRVISIVKGNNEERREEIR